jgi:hypothetical protein
LEENSLAEVTELLTIVVKDVGYIIAYFDLKKMADKGYRILVCG